MTSTPNNKPQLSFLDGIRALAAVYVMLHHAVLQYFDFSVDSIPTLQKLLISPFFYGRLAVDLFIVLSGFCLMISVSRHNLAFRGGLIRFFKRRIIRIVPPYVLAIAFSMLLISLFIGEKAGTHWDISVPYTQSDVIFHLLLINDLFLSHSFTINHSLWSIPVEFRIYFLFPILVYLIKRLGWVLAGLIVFCFSFLLFQGLVFWSESFEDLNLTLPGVSPYVFLFFLGMWSADLVFRSRAAFRSTKARSAPLYLLICAVLVYLFVEVVLVSGPESGDSYLSRLNDIAFGLIISIVLFVLADNEISGWLKRFLLFFLESKLLQQIGRFSFSLYLIHAPLIQVIYKFVVEPLGVERFGSTLILMVVCLLTIVPFSFLFYSVFERPFMRLQDTQSNKGQEGSMRSVFSSIFK